MPGGVAVGAGALAGSGVAGTGAGVGFGGPPDAGDAGGTAALRSAAEALVNVTGPSSNGSGEPPVRTAAAAVASA